MPLLCGQASQAARWLGFISLGTLTQTLWVRAWQGCRGRRRWRWRGSGSLIPVPGFQVALPSVCWGEGETCLSTGPSPEPQLQWLSSLLSGSSCPRAFAWTVPAPPRLECTVCPSDAASSGRPALAFPPRAGAPFPMPASSMVGAAASHRSRVPSQACWRFAEQRSDWWTRVQRSGAGA